MSGQAEELIAPPAWEFTAKETVILCGALRRYLYPSASWKPMEVPDDELELVLDRLFSYLSVRQRWENLHLNDDTPF